jgi:hypothetical protein
MLRMGKFCYESSALLTEGIGLSISNRLTEWEVWIGKASSVLVMEAAIREPTSSLYTPGILSLSPRNGSR